MEKDCHIVVAAPDQPPAQFQLRGTRVGVGRGQDNQITVEHDSVSSTHCEFRQTEGGYEVVDVGSTNGTRVNGSAVKDAPQALGDGDRILLSEVVPVYFYRLASGEQAPLMSAESDPQTLATAGALASMGEKIAAMKAQEAELAQGIEAMKAEFMARQTEVAQMKAGIEQQAADLAAKKGTADDGEITRMEEELFTATRRWKLMASDLEGKQAELESLGAGAGAQAPTLPGAAPMTPAATAAPATPATPETIYLAGPRIAAPAVTPAAAPTGGAPTVPLVGPRTSGPPTVQLNKSKGAEAPRIQRKADSEPPTLKRREDS